ncbi:hypothetical protein QBC45DRAFT_418812 [Copromyces sp. CBS 386.78]|nr:hypothetical protein QBC45DRAFT_418812 [Copromyces sp. CBS 386.78]
MILFFSSFFLCVFLSILWFVHREIFHVSFVLFCVTSIRPTPSPFYVYRYRIIGFLFVALSSYETSVISPLIHPD